MSTLQHREPSTFPSAGNGELDLLESKAVAASPTGLSDCRKKLRWLIGNPPENMALPMSIGPAMAQAMMERNKNDEWQNRPQSDKGLKRYIEAMRRGWQYTGETIVFSGSGRLLNGQHRLVACINAGVRFPCLVAFDVPDDAFKFMDIGIRRTAGHIFSIEGIKNANLVAAIARIVYSYQSSNSWGGRVFSEVENDDLLEFYYKHEGIQRSLKHARLLHDLLVKRWAGACHYICAQKNRAEADEFFECIATGLKLDKKTDPRYVARKRLIDNRGKNPGDKQADAYLAAYVMKAWNARRRGEPLNFIKWRTEQNPNEVFPRAI